MMTADEPFCVPPGWDHAVLIPNVGGPSHRVLYYPDGSRRFEHRCDRGDRGAIICAPLLRAEHVEVRSKPLTITPSILCPDCGTHGFVTNGVWAA